MGEDINSIDDFKAAVKDARRQGVPEGSILNWVAAYFGVDQMTAKTTYAQYRDGALKVGSGEWLIEKDVQRDGSLQTGRKTVDTTLRIKVWPKPAPVEDHLLLLPVQPRQRTRKAGERKQPSDSSIPPYQEIVSTVQGQEFPPGLKEEYRGPYALLRENAWRLHPGGGWVVGEPQTILHQYGPERSKAIAWYMKYHGWLKPIEDTEMGELGLFLKDLRHNVGHGHGRYFWLRLEGNSLPNKKKGKTSKKLHPDESPEGLTPCRQTGWDALRSEASEHDPEKGWRVQYVNRILEDALGEKAGHTVLQWLRAQGFLVPCDNHIRRGGGIRSFWLRARGQSVLKKRSKPSTTGASKEAKQGITLEAMERRLAALSRRVKALEKTVASLRASRDSDVG